MGLQKPRKFDYLISLNNMNSSLPLLSAHNIVVPTVQVVKDDLSLE